MRWNREEFSVGDLFPCPGKPNIHPFGMTKIIYTLLWEQGARGESDNGENLCIFSDVL